MTKKISYGFAILFSLFCFSGFDVQASDPSSNPWEDDALEQSQFNPTTQQIEAELLDGQLVPSGYGILSKLLSPLNTVNRFYGMGLSNSPEERAVKNGGLLELIHFFVLDPLSLSEFPLAGGAAGARVIVQALAINELIKAGEWTAAAAFSAHLASDITISVAKYGGADEMTQAIIGIVGAAVTVPLCCYQLWSMAHRYSRPKED